MATTYYLDKRTLITPENTSVVLKNLQNYLNVTTHISNVVEDLFETGTLELSSINVDTINEATAANGVTIDGVNIKDGKVDLNGLDNGLVLDADGDTAISAVADDQIDFHIGGSDRGNWTSARLAVTGGILSNGATNGIGYMTGAGGAVTQITSRTTGVEINKASGAITLVSAAGSTTPATFTVTNSAVDATDTVVVSQKSGTDLYHILVTAVAAGSFNITFFTTGGTTTEQPVFNFTVIKGVAA